MAISRQKKEQLLAQYTEMLENAQGVVITEYRGMPVKQLDELRAKLRENNAGFTITKNTLLKIALEQLGMGVPEDLLNGPVALAVAYEDLPRTIKAVLEYAAGNEILITKGGVTGTAIVAQKDLKTLSELPPLDVLRGQLLGMVTMPMTQLLGLFEEPSRQLVAVIKAGSEGLVNVLAAYAATGDEEAA